MDSRGSSHRTPYMPRIRNADENRISSPSANANNGSQRSSTGSAMLRASPYSPFPFGLPIQSSNRSILSPGSIDQELSRNEDVNKKDQFSSDTNNDTSSLHTFRRRVRAQDVYGGPLMFGGSPSYSASSSSASGQMKARNQRVLLSGSPYHCAAASRIAAKQQGRQRPSHSSSTTPSPSGSSTSSAPGLINSNPSQTSLGSIQNRPLQHSPAHLFQQSPNHLLDPNSSNSSSYSRPSSSLASASAKSVTAQANDESGLSSTARLILDTLDKMSTPLRDAQKMSTVLNNTSLNHDISASIDSRAKVSRAERRRMIAEALDASSVSMNLSNSSLSMQNDLGTTPYDNSGRAKRRRPNLGAPINGDMIQKGSPGCKNNYFNGPPLRSLAFWPKSKDVGAPQVPLKSARIPNLEESRTIQPNMQSPQPNPSNANKLGVLVSSSSPIQEVKRNSSTANITEPTFTKAPFNIPSNLNSKGHQFSSASKDIQLPNNNVGGAVINISQPEKFGGKIKTKLQSGLEQAKAQRGSATLKKDEALESTSETYRLQETKSLSSFLAPNNTLTGNRGFSIPNIDTSSPQTAKPTNCVENLDRPLLQSPLVSKSSLKSIEKNQDILTRKAGAYQNPESTMPITTKAGVSNDAKDGTTFAAPKTIVETPFSNKELPPVDKSVKKFVFSSAVNLLATASPNINDHVPASPRKFQFCNPSYTVNIATHEDSSDRNFAIKMKHEKANNISPSLGQDGPLPDLTKTAGDLMNPTPTSIFRSNGSSMPNSNVLNKNNGDEYSRNTDVIVPEPKNFLSSSSVMTAPMGGKEKSVSSPFSPNFFPSNANSHSLILNKGAPTTFGPGSSSTSSIFQTGNTSMTSSAVPKVGQLLSGSVMDILSGTSTQPAKSIPIKQNESKTASGWDPKFKLNEKAWNFN